jgi:hypothetical protein
MASALLQFQNNIDSIKDLKGTTDTISSITTPVLNVSDFYRAQIVLVVSALDHFVHEHVLTEMIEIYRGNKSVTSAFMKFPIPLSCAYNSTSRPLDILVLDAIRTRHSWLSFQDPDKIADAIRLISEMNIWEELARNMRLAPRDLKTRIKLIIERRNKIAHEADMDPTNPGEKWPITSNDVLETINFVSKVVLELYNITH